jgi:uncharacterized membrane protein YcaP (DUF421 family)
MPSWLFETWSGVARTALVGVLAYGILVTLLRISGKRTLSKMNAFDLVVTVALGSTLATILLSKDVALAEGVTALVTLIGLQLIVAWLSARSEQVDRLVKSEPTLLAYRGEFLRDALLRMRVTEGEVLAAVRQQGIAALEQAEAVVLETDGSFTVVRPAGSGVASALANVSGYSGERPPRPEP